jgi:integrase/recombinase XerD
MAHLFLRGGTWWAKWYDPPTVQHRKSLGTRDKLEAKALFKEIEAKLARGRHVVFPGARPLADVLEDFLADKRARREARTAQSYEGHAKHFRRLLPTSMKIGAIEAVHIDKYLQARMRETSPETANKERTTLMILFNWAIKREYADRNPVLRIERFSTRPKERPDIGRADFAKLRADVEADAKSASGEEKWKAELLRDAVVTIWWSGLRIGELARLRPEDVNLESEEYAVRSAANKGPRVLPMHPEVKAIFKRRMKMAKNRLFGTGDPENEDGYWMLEDAWKLFVRRHPEHDRRGFHALRHAFNTRMHDVIDNPLIAMRATGHKTIQMSSHYTRVGVEKVRDALKRLA